MQRPRHVREMLRQKPKEVIADNFATPKTGLKPIGTYTGSVVSKSGKSFITKSLSSGFTKSPGTEGLLSQSSTSTFWLHHTGLQHSSPVGYLGTAILGGQKSSVELDKLSYASRNGLSDRDRKKRSKPTPLARYDDGRTILDANESETVLVKDERVSIWTPRQSELYHKESDVTLAPPPVPRVLPSKARQPLPVRDKNDPFEIQAEKARKYLSTFTKDNLLKPDELPCADG